MEAYNYLYRRCDYSYGRTTLDWGNSNILQYKCGKTEIGEGIIKVHLERHTFAKELKSIEGWE
jgi:hypothetical protein